jgi:protein-S-isoprenylcysteine O-methyltransferase Ste14
MFERQWIHLLALVLLLTALVRLDDIEVMRAGSLWKWTSPGWLWWTIWLAIAHQTWVVLWWRSELHHQLSSRKFGDAGFILYAIGFSILGIARTLAVWLLAISNQGTLPLPPGLMKVVAVLLATPALYLFYSVRKYFGFRRAFGYDHWDPAYSHKPMVRQGIFRYTSNGMYVFGFLILWVPAFWFASVAALAAALFNHLYIWVHYYATERPDMKRIYNTGGDY